MYKTIEHQLGTVLLLTVPPFISAMTRYGTIGLHFLRDDYDPNLHPKVLSIEIDRWNMHRWIEVDDRNRTIIMSAYRAHYRISPPIRYYEGGVVLLSSPFKIPPTSSGQNSSTTILCKNWAPSLENIHGFPTSDFVRGLRKECSIPRRVRIES